MLVSLSDGSHRAVIPTDYRIHHDQNAAPFTPQGPRLYTFFMYLNTPEEGGGTRFNDLGITVQAKKGRAVLWPSLMDQNVSLPELWTHHEAMPVERGVKCTDGTDEPPPAAHYDEVTLLSDCCPCVQMGQTYGFISMISKPRPVDDASLRSRTHTIQSANENARHQYCTERSRDGGSRTACTLATHMDKFELANATCVASCRSKLQLYLDARKNAGLSERSPRSRT